jgi:hypothetical protein
MAWGACLSCAAHSQGALSVSDAAWNSLAPQERAAIQQAQVVDVRRAGSFGLVIDNQGVNESTPGTNAGAAIGGAFAEAAYIDRAFKPGNNYSAKNQLAVGILGAIIGSSLDKPAVAQYHFRYALKLSDGEIVYRDSVESQPFRHPAGMCLDTTSLTPLPQTLCTHTVADLRRLYLTQAVAATPIVVAPPISEPPRPVEAATVDAAARVECKVGNLSPASTTAEKCNLIGGKIL